MSDRRKFIKNMSGLGMLGVAPGLLLPESNSFSAQQSAAVSKIWGCLLHLSYNFWLEYSTPSPFRGYRPYLQMSESLWNDATEKMAKEGLNMVVMTWKRMDMIRSRRVAFIERMGQAKGIYISWWNFATRILRTPACMVFYKHSGRLPRKTIGKAS